MIEQLTSLNWLGVLLAYLAYFMLGYLWYTVIFAKQYKASLGRSNESLPNKPIFIVGPAICTFVCTVTSAILLQALNIKSSAGAVEFALVIGIGFLVANTINIAINPNIPRPIFYGIITGSYHLLGLLIATIILVAMK